MRAAVLLSLTLACGPAAAIYKCPGAGGRVSFQDQPCASGGQQIDVRPAAGAAPASAAPAAAGNGTASPAVAPADRLHQMQRESAVMEAERKIRDAEHQIDIYRQEMEAKIDGLRAKKRRANNNLAGATWEQSISAEMQAVADEYRTKIDGERATIADLRARRERLLAGE